MASFTPRQFLVEKIDVAKEQRKATNITLPPEMLREAKENGINISSVTEQALRQILEQLRQRHWEETNREFIDEYNRRIETQGTALGQWRKF
jgi:antitoxin CcdA